MEVALGIEPSHRRVAADRIPTLLCDYHLVETEGIKPSAQCLQGTVALLEHAPPYLVPVEGVEPPRR